MHFLKYKNKRNSEFTESQEAANQRHSMGDWWRKEHDNKEKVGGSEKKRAATSKLFCKWEKNDIKMKSTLWINGEIYRYERPEPLEALQDNLTRNQIHRNLIIIVTCSRTNLAYKKNCKFLLYMNGRYRPLKCSRHMMENHSQSWLPKTYLSCSFMSHCTKPPILTQSPPKMTSL